MGCDMNQCIVPECHDMFMHGGEHTFWLDGKRTKMARLDWLKLPGERRRHPKPERI